MASPRLPSVADYGLSPAPRSAGSVNSFRADIVQKAQADGFRQQAESAGKMMRLGEQIKKEADNRQDDRDSLDLTKSRSSFLADKIELDAKYANDPDFKTMPGRYSKDLDALRKKHGEGLSGKGRERYDAATSPDVARGNVTAGARALDKEKDNALSETARILESNRNAALKAPDTATQQALIGESLGAIRSAAARGFITAQQAEKMTRDWKESYATSRIAMQPPEAQHRALGVPEGWSPGDPLPPREATGTIADFIPEDVRVKMARQAMPGVNAKVSQAEADNIVAGGGGLESQLAKARKITNPTVRDEVERRVKAEYGLQETLKKERSVRSSQQEADTIHDSGLGIQGQLAAAREIEDPDVRDATVTRIRNRANEDKAVESAQLKEKKTEAVGLAQNGKFDEIDPGVLADLGGAMTETLRKISSQARRGAPQISDPKIENELNQMPPEELEKADLLNPKYLNGLSASRHTSWLDTQGRLVREKDPAQRTALRTRSQIVSGDLKAAGLAKNTDAVALFNRRMDEEILALEQRTGKKAQPQEIQAISDRLLIAGEVVGSVIDPDKRFFQVEPGEDFFISDVDEIPQAQMTGFKGALERFLGRPASDDEVVDEYNSYLKNGR